MEPINFEELKSGSKNPPHSLQPCGGDAYLLFQVSEERKMIIISVVILIAGRSCHGEIKVWLLILYDILYIIPFELHDIMYSLTCLSDPLSI